MSVNPLLGLIRGMIRPAQATLRLVQAGHSEAGHEYLETSSGYLLADLGHLQNRGADGRMDGWMGRQNFPKYSIGHCSLLGLLLCLHLALAEPPLARQGNC